MNITLIGMPGSGKSFVGKKLAERLGYKFFDTDKMIESEHGLPLQQILEKLGEESLLEAEANLTIANLENGDNTVASPGGSIVYNDKTMGRLQQISTIIYLKAALPVLEKRIGEVPRGIVGLKRKTFAELYLERVPRYEKWSALIVDAEQDAGMVIQDILKQF